MLQTVQVAVYTHACFIQSTTIVVTSQIKHQAAIHVISFNARDGRRSYFTPKQSIIALYTRKCTAPFKNCKK